MQHRLRGGLQQLNYLFHELRMFNAGHPAGWFTCWFNASAIAVMRYRVTRGLHLTLGTGWRVAHTILLPVFFLIRPWTKGCDISPRAAIGKGLRVAYPSLGVVVSDAAIIGDNLYLVGGNCIGGRAGPMQPGDIRIGNDVILGVNAVVIGPITIGDGVLVKAGSVLARDTPAVAR